jgi:hypothetical protein
VKGVIVGLIFFQVSKLPSRRPDIRRVIYFHIYNGYFSSETEREGYFLKMKFLNVMRSINKGSKWGGNGGRKGGSEGETATLRSTARYCKFCGN